MYFKVLLICVVVSLASGIPQPFIGGWGATGGMNPWAPWAMAKPGPEVNPWLSWWASSQPDPTANPSAPSQVAPNPWSPWASNPWATNPWAPQGQPCTAMGADCLDCSTRIVCTKIGSFEQTCSNPTKPYCNLGKCSDTPSAACAPATPVEDDENV